MSGMLLKYVDLQVHDDPARANELLRAFAAMSEEEHALHYGGSALVGECFIKDSPGVEQCVLEVVLASDGADSCATLFKAHPLFNTRVSYLEGREELMKCLLDLANASVGGIGVMCPVRRRNVNVRDLGIHQLIELGCVDIQVMQTMAPTRLMNEVNRSASFS